MNQADLESWADRAAQELQELADDTEEAGCSAEHLRALLREYQAIHEGRPVWQTAALRAPGTGTPAALNLD